MPFSILLIFLIYETGYQLALANLSLALASVMLLGMMVVGCLKRLKVNHIFSPLLRPNGPDIGIVT